MASIGDLVAHLSVSSAPFTKGLKSATGAVSKFASSAGATMASVGAVAAVGLAAVAAGATAAFYVASQSIGKLAGVADEAARTGLSGDFLLKLGYAADQSGVSSETLAKSVAKMSLTLAEAKNGSDTAAKAFGAIGVSVAELSSMTPEQQLATIADGLGAIPDAGQRAAAAMDIFGKAGQELGPMFEGGSAALSGLLNQAGSLGIGISEEDLARAAAADDAMSRMKATVGALVDKFSLYLAPAITFVSDSITQLTPVFSSVMDTFATGLSGIGSWFADIFTGVVTTVVKAMSVAEYAFSNFGAIVDYTLVNSQIGVIAFIGTLGHFFGVQLPAYLSWFGSNWYSVWETASSMVGTVFVGIVANIMSAWTAIINFITGETESLEFVWTPLTEGFVNTIAKLPDIQARAIGEVEQGLRAKSKTMGDALGQGLAATIEKNLAKIPDMSIKGVNGMAKTLDDSDANKPKATETKFAGALEAGSAGAYSAIVAAMGRSGEPKVANQQLSVQQQLLAEARKQNKPGQTRLKVVEAIA